MKFKIGDKVRIKPLKEFLCKHEQKTYAQDFLFDIENKYQNQIVTIIGYHLSEEYEIQYENRILYFGLDDTEIIDISLEKMLRKIYEI